MKDCCRPDAPKGKFKRTLNVIITSIILLLLGTGVLITLIQLFRG